MITIASKIKKNNPIINGNPTKDEIVYPIKNMKDIARMKNYWLNNKKLKMGRRNWTIFKLGVVTGLRASDLVSLRWNQVFDSNDDPRTYIYGEKDQKTGKNNHYLYIKQAHDDLILYKDWLHKRIEFNPPYLFPKIHDAKGHLVVHSLYYIMRRIGDTLGIPHVGTHSIRKTFGFIAFKETHNLTYVMKRLSQSTPDVTLRYIGIDKESMEQISSKLHFDI